MKNRIGYTPYGDTNGVFDVTGGQVDPYTGGPINATTNSVTASELRYRGYLYDGVTGWYVTGARMYNPSVGAFTTEDPARADGNFYSYCGGNPVGRWDPSGLCWTDNTPANGNTGAVGPDWTYHYGPWRQYYNCDDPIVKNHKNGDTWTSHGYTTTVGLCPVEQAVRDPSKAKRVEDVNGIFKENIPFEDYQVKSQRRKNAIFIYLYLRNRGWYENPIFAVLGNMSVESGLSPGRWQKGVGPGFGLIQWDNRKNNLLQFLKEKGYENDSMIGQLEYMLYEMFNGVEGRSIHGAASLFLQVGIFNLLWSVVL